MQVIIINHQNGEGIFEINIDASKIDATKFTQWRALIIAEIKRRFNVDLTDKDIAQIKFRPTNDFSQPGVVHTNDAVSIAVQPTSAFITIRLPQLKTELLLQKKCREIANSFNQIFDILVNREEVLDELNFISFYVNMYSMPAGKLCSIKGMGTKRRMLELVKEGLQQHYKETIDCQILFDTAATTIGNDTESSYYINISSTKYNFFSFDPNILLSYLKNRVINIAGLAPVIKKSEVRARHQALNLLIGAIENNAVLALNIIRDGKVFIDGIIEPCGYRYSVPLNAVTSYAPFDKQRITTDSERAEITRQLILKGANIAVTFYVTGIQSKTLLDPDRLFPLTEPGKVLVEAVYTQTESIVSDHPEIVDPKQLKPFILKSSLKPEQIDIILGYVSPPNPEVDSLLNRRNKLGARMFNLNYVSQLKQLGKAFAESRQPINVDTNKSTVSSHFSSWSKVSETLSYPISSIFSWLYKWCKRPDTLSNLSRMPVLSLPASAIDTPKMPSMASQLKSAALKFQLDSSATSTAAMPLRADSTFVTNRRTISSSLGGSSATGLNVASCRSRSSFILDQADVVANNDSYVIVLEPATSVATNRLPVDEEQGITAKLKTPLKM